MIRNNMGIISVIKNKFNLLFGYRHWFLVSTKYYSKKNKEVFSLFSTIGIIKKGNCINDRFLKKQIYKKLDFSTLDIENKNGKIYITGISYLGYFKK